LQLEAAVTTRILVVDDAPAIRRSMRLYLEQEGDWTICGEAENGKVAIDRVRELRPDVVILDLSMPVMNGLEAARIIKTIAPGTRILMFTLHNYPCLSDEARKAGIDQVLSKADSMDGKLLQAVRTLITKPWCTNSRLFLC
jgi:two-component system, chemotaxis family, chemotaxis protein CheY